MENYDATPVSDVLSRRFVTKDDESKLLIWRNKANVRKFSRSLELIDREAHSLWFKARLLEMRKQPLFIFEFEQKPIGMSRLDCINDIEDLFEISVIVDESFQNRGFATEMISQTLVFAKNELEVKEITATIHIDNFRSIQLFTRLNFRRKAKLLDKFDEFRIYL